MACVWPELPFVIWIVIKYPNYLLLSLLLGPQSYPASLALICSWTLWSHCAHHCCRGIWIWTCELCDCLSEFKQFLQCEMWKPNMEFFSADFSAPLVLQVLTVVSLLLLSLQRCQPLLYLQGLVSLLRFHVSSLIVCPLLILKNPPPRHTFGPAWTLSFHYLWRYHTGQR